MPDPPLSPVYQRSKSDVGPRSMRRGSHTATDSKSAGGHAGRGILGAVRKGLGRLANGMRKRLPSPKRQASPRPPRNRE